MVETGQSGDLRVAARHLGEILFVRSMAETWRSVGRGEPQIGDVGEETEFQKFCGGLLEEMDLPALTPDTYREALGE